MENLGDIYNTEEYTTGTESEKSALEIVPYLYHILDIRSIVDVGGVSGHG